MHRQHTNSLCTLTSTTDYYSVRGLAECPNCHRTFESLALEKHMKGCKVREFTFGLVLDDSIDDADADDATDSAHEAEHESDAEK